MTTRRGIGRIASAATALVVSAALFLIAARGIGPLPPLGPTFNPGTDVWTIAADAALPRTGTFYLAGLERPVRVVFNRNGTAQIQAATDADLFWTIGYLHARFRLFQMDLERRQGEGLLAEVIGPRALSSDEFEDRLGLDRTAQMEWSSLPSGSPARQALLTYAAGVNARIREDERTHDWPLLFKMLGYQPRPWTPLDSLVIQGIMAQTLDFTTAPLDYAVLTRSLGYRRTMQWFPILPPNAQNPYDPGPYHAAGLAPLPAQQNVDAVTAQAAMQLASQLAALPAFALHHGSNSNNWAVDGHKTASGKPLLAGDPHLHQTLPAIWYQIATDAPSYHISGVGIPGTPVILIGRNRHIAWSLTNTQNQATLFYVEQTSSAHPDAYYWRGAWRHMRTVAYSIPLKGSRPVRFEVKLTVHGPVMSDDRLPGRTLTVDWMGAHPSPDISAMLGIARASDFHAFRNALRSWYAPSQNFVYADDRGHIGLVSAGLYPLVRSGAPWLPLPGTGQADVVGTIPFDAIPQVYDPPGHLVFSANQRPVGPGYPYYIGTTLDFFDPGYRADEIAAFLQHHSHLTARDMERLQTGLHDHLAGLIVPRLLAALRGQRLSAREQQARALLQSWDGTMGADSAAASIWATFWSWYCYDTFQPWWDAFHVPYQTVPSLSVKVPIGEAPASLDEDLEVWTLHDQTNTAFTPPHGSRRTAGDVMMRAFRETVAAEARTLGGDPRSWRWGRLHSRQFDSLARIPALGYGPSASGGDPWTVDAADGDYTSTAGPSWRFVMDWGTAGGVGVYPGGQSENPLSPWYQDQIAAWWNGQYYPLPAPGGAQTQQDKVTWTLEPSR